MNIQDVLVRLLSVITLIALNAFFVTAEFSIVSVRQSRISQLVQAGDLQAQTVQSLQRSIERLLSTTQLGITLSSLALGWIGEGTMAVLVQKLINYLPFPEKINQSIAHSFSVPIAFSLIVYLQIVLGELCPKSVALIYSEQLARFFAPPSLTIARVFHPFIGILNRSTRFLLRLFGIEYTGGGRNNLVTPEELQLIIATEKESTGLEDRERELLQNVFSFGEVIVSSVMVPRTNTVAIPTDASIADFLETVATIGYSRYPAIGESLDDIQGIIDWKNPALALAQGYATGQTSIAPWIEQAHFVPESTLLRELLALMQQEKIKMVIVVDEFGGTCGLVTLQDLVQEIIGDLTASNSWETIDLQKLDANTFLVGAQMNLEQVNEFLGLDLPLTDEYQTLGGFLLYEWQKIPQRGETFIYQNLEFTVIAAQGPKLSQIRIHILST